MPFGKAGSACVVRGGLSETFDTVLQHLCSSAGDTWTDSWVEDWLSFPNLSGGEQCQVQLAAGNRSEVDGSVLVYDFGPNLDGGMGLLAN